MSFGLPGVFAVCCKKVRFCVPKVRLARFHKESFPSRLGRADVGLSTGSGIALGDVSKPDDMLAVLVMDFGTRFN